MSFGTLFLSIALACGPSYEEEELARAVKQKKVEAIREMLRYSGPTPEAKGAAQREIEKLRAAARAAMRQKVPAERREARAFAEALSSWLSAHDSEAVVVAVTDPDVRALEANDAIVTKLLPPPPPSTAGWSQPPPPSAGAAPAAPAFRGGAEYAIGRALDETFGRVFPHGAVRAVRWRDAGPGEHPAAEVTYSVEPTGRMFHVPSVRRDLVGVVLRFDVVLRVPGGPTFGFHHDAEPPDTFQSRTDAIAIAADSTLWGAGVTDRDTYAGMAEAAIATLGERLYSELTGAPLARPPAPPREVVREELCSQGDDDACIEIARGLSKSTKAEERRRAIQLLDPLCLLRRRTSVCSEVAWLRLRASDELHDADAASSMAYGGCEDGDAASCYLRGQIYARDPEVAPFLTGPMVPRRDEEEARRSYQRACVLGSAEACSRLQ